MLRIGFLQIQCAVQQTVLRSSMNDRLSMISFLFAKLNMRVTRHKPGPLTILVHPNETLICKYQKLAFVSGTDSVYIHTIVRDGSGVFFYVENQKVVSCFAIKRLMKCFRRSTIQSCSLR